MSALNSLLILANGPVGRWSLAGLCATLLGVGLARFSYTPLIPALVAQGWLSAPEAVYAGAANLAGYLAGALLARPLSLRWPPVAVLRGSMALAVLSFLACAAPLGFGWMAPWRFLAGLSGAVLIVLAAPTVLGATPAGLRGRAGGLIFTGIGLGIVLSGTLVPVLAPFGLATVWLALGTAGAALTVVAWRRWPEAAASTPRPTTATPRPHATTGALVLATLAYASDGIGYVPHTVFLSDFVARGLGQGIAAGGAYWAAFGAGAVMGPFAAGWLADRIGFSAAFVAVLAVKAVAVALPLVSTTALVLGTSAVTVGALTLGLVALASGLAAHLVGSADHAWAWGRMTATYAVMQAAGAWVLSWLFARTGSYRLLFAIGAGALVLGTLCAVAALMRTTRPGPASAAPTP